MGIFVGIFSAIVIYIFTSTQLSFKTKHVEMRNSHQSFIVNKTPVGTKSTLDNFDTDEIEKSLIRTCQTAQSWVLTCKNCYSTGETTCPYPTDSFCQGARTVNMTDADTFWSFLPNTSGSLSDIKTAPTVNSTGMTSISQLSQGQRFILNNVFDYSKYSNYKYYRPSGTSSDVCAVSNIIGN